MRRVRFLVVFAALLGLLMGPTANSANAQVPALSAEAVIVGETLGDGAAIPPVGRVADESRFVDTAISFVVECGGLDPEVIIGTVTQPAGANQVDFRADDDVSDGHGDVLATGTATSGDFSTANATEVVGGTSTASATFEIDGGSFDRVLNVVTIELTLDITIDRDPTTPGVTCAAADVALRIEAVLVPKDAMLDTGFLLIGVGRTDPGATVGRAACDAVEPAPGLGGAGEPCGFTP